MTILEKKIHQEVEHVLRELPADKMEEVLDFVMFLKERCAEEKLHKVTDPVLGTLNLRTMPPSHLDHLTGLVEWGGDSLAESERLYDDKP